MTAAEPAVLIVGAGIGGLTTALELHRAGVSCRVVEAAPAFGPLGVGINILPHAARELDRLGLEERLSARGITTREQIFFNRFGQLIYAEPAGWSASTRMTSARSLTSRGPTAPRRTWRPAWSSPRTASTRPSAPSCSPTR